MAPSTSTISQAHARLESARARRQAFWRDPGHKEPWDAVIIGGGVQGACTYHRLAAAGLRALLIDRRDFAAGTSQASAMLVWGGLLYLRNGHFAEVWRLCAARDELARCHSRWVEPHRMRYVFSRRRRYQSAVVGAALAAYWLLGRCRRSRPRWEPRFDEQAMLGDATTSITFEEARLSSSDAQFVMRWLTQAPNGSGCRAVNYAELVNARWDRDGGLWHVDLRDALDDYQAELKARCIINAAGVWADQVQERCGILSPWTHALSKGASLSIPRQPWHGDTLVFDDVGPARGCSLVPWGPVSLWGSTETWARSIAEGFRPTTQDVHYLLRVLNRHVGVPIHPREIISLRCGIRPLAVRRGQRLQNSTDPLALSRRHVVWRDRDRPWVAIYGGKLTGAPSVAEQVWNAVREFLPHRAVAPGLREAPLPSVETDRLCRLQEPVPSAAWCLEHAQCWTLEDYLRRRTNIAQWVPRAGLGHHGEHETDLLRAAIMLTGDIMAARRALDNYRCRVANDHDAILAEVSDQFADTATREVIHAEFC